MALGLVLQQALIISTLVFLAILALWTQAGPLLLLAGALVSCPCSRHATISACDDFLHSITAFPGSQLEPVQPSVMMCCRWHLQQGLASMAAGQEPEIVAGAVMYLQLSAPALWCYAMAECLKRYLLAQVKARLASLNAMKKSRRQQTYTLLPGIHFNASTLPHVFLLIRPKY